MYNTVRTLRNGKPHVTCQKQCSIDKKVFTVSVPLTEWKLWQNGSSTKEAFPNLTQEQREFLVTGKTPKEKSNEHSSQSTV